MLALAKAPAALAAAYAARGVALEVCPRSNGALQYAPDPRDHPAARLLGVAGLPLTLSPDDPAALGYDDVAHDWFAAFASWDVDLARCVGHGTDASQGSCL